MVIVYPDEEITFPNRSETDRYEKIMLSEIEQTKVEKKIKFDPELFIYVQKLMKEQGKSFDEILNNMIREHAEDSLKITQISYVQPVVKPYTYPYVYPYKYDYKTNPWGSTITYCDNSNESYTTTYTNDCVNFWYNPKQKHI